MSATWGTERLDFGTVTGSRSVYVPGDFSSAVTLVVTLSAERFTPHTGALQWGLFDSVDGEHWQLVEDTRGEYYRGQDIDSRRAFGTRRFVVPFGPRLMLTLFQTEATFENVIATVFWRGLG